MKAPVMVEALRASRDRLAQKLARFGLEASIVDAMLSHHTLVRYPRGATIFAQGSAADVIFLIVGGVVKMGCQRATGERVILGLAGLGDLIGFADSKDSRGVGSQLFEAEAMTGVTLALITREHLARVLRQLQAPLLLELLAALNSMWAESLANWAMMLGRSLRRRLECVLGDLAARFGVHESRGRLLPLELGQQALAEMIGGSRPMVGKLLQDLERDGVIVRQGRQFIIVRNDGVGANEASNRPRAHTLSDGADQRRPQVLRRLDHPV